MRRGELLGLTWNQVDLKARIARLSPHDTKERRSKRVPLRSEVVAVLEQWRRVRSLATDKVFLIDGRPPNGESIKNPWLRACKAVALVDHRPRLHDLRHTWRANARRSGMEPALAESFLGHRYRERSVNERCGRVSDAELLTAVDAMTFDNGPTEIVVNG